MSEPVQLLGDKCVYVHSTSSHLGQQLRDLRARELVLRNDIDSLLDLRQKKGVEISAAVEYAASRGRHRITQALLAAGVPVTSLAILNAVNQGGPGLGYLLKALSGESLGAALNAALRQSMRIGKFEVAAELLDRGAIADRDSFIEMEMNDWRGRKHEGLDLLMPRADRSVLADHGVIEFILNYGRPLHIERLADRLGVTANYLWPHALRSNADARTTLANMGARVDSSSFEEVMASNAQIGPQERVYFTNLILQEFHHREGPILSFERAEPWLDWVMQGRSHVWRFLDQGTSSQAEVRVSIADMISVIHHEHRRAACDYIGKWMKAKTFPEPVIDLVTQTALDIKDELGLAASENLAPFA